MKAKLIKKEKVADSIYSFWFEPEQKSGFIAGQFIELSLPHKSPDKRSYKRWFTISSSPTEAGLAITTRFTSMRPSSFKSSLLNLKVGEIVDISSPMGDFVMPKLKSIPLVFVGLGIGITPFRSMIKFLEDSGERRDVTLVYRVSSESDLAFDDLFLKSDINYKKVINTHLSAALIQSLIQITSKHYIYISGPEHIVEKLSKELSDSGILTNHIYSDFFQGYK